ncbi:MAG: indole-3-glycerol phosphate synthase TrpC [Balneolaceae bacterium]
MSTILDRIVEQTREDLAKRKRKISFGDLSTLPSWEREIRDFAGALRGEDLAIIAEVKRASPSKGVIREDFDPVAIAREYTNGGAAAISVLTDMPFFQGKLEYMEQISREIKLPLLRKDFIIDPYQVKEARAWGGDALLLIAAILSDAQLEELLHAAREYELHALVECYSDSEVERMNWEQVRIFGVNNRDLNTFEVDLHRGVSLLQQSPQSVIRVSESGLNQPEDLDYLREQQIDAALIGESLMREKSPEEALRYLLTGSKKELRDINRQKVDK